MNNKNLPGRAGLKPKFEDGVKTFIEWLRINVDIWMKIKLGALAESERTHSLEPMKIIMRLLVSLKRLRSQPQLAMLRDGCNQSQLGVVVELVDIKVDGHIYERIYDRISQWTNRILPSNHSLSRDYYNTKKLVNDLDLPVEKIHAYKNGCMLYWKDNVDLEYCKFCRDGGYKPA
ncbi:hypothetical protein Sango_2779400 [Sesamum angolense]|uniref:Uncharacterized protein n=1 Tax=Sesamum angolense TaxID=2727404 RepID=A0AAE1W012_9LAMI|nr:hypothetical protein Sango_2779400 [Sesamum angolense]